MFIAVQFPIADLRSFLTVQRLPRPNWPGTQHEFLRCFGGIKSGARRSLDSVKILTPDEKSWLSVALPHWTYDTTYCTARQAMKLPELSKVLLGQHRPRRVFRRLFSDGHEHVRFEISMAIDHPEHHAVDAEAIHQLVNAFTKLRTRVVAYQEPPASETDAPPHKRTWVENELLGQGTALARLFDNSTLPRSERTKKGSSLVVAGMPVILIEFRKEELAGWNDRWIRLDPVQLAGVELAYATTKWKGDTIGVWLLEHGQQATAVRNLRLCIFQAHAEREILRSVIDKFRSDEYRAVDQSNLSQLAEYLIRSKQMLEANSKFGCGLNEIQAVLGEVDRIRPGAIDLLENQLQSLIDRVSQARPVSGAVMPKQRPIPLAFVEFLPSKFAAAELIDLAKSCFPNFRVNNAEVKPTAIAASLVEFADRTRQLNTLACEIRRRIPDGFREAVSRLYVMEDERSDSGTLSTSPMDSAKSAPHEKRFRIALSFPGSQRDIILKVANVLAKSIGHDRVLYDSWYSNEFACPRLAIYLPELYYRESELVVVFLGKDYATREWCNMEWDAILSMKMEGRGRDIMFLRFDMAEIPGLNRVDGVRLINGESAEEIAEWILGRLDSNRRLTHDGSIVASDVVPPSNV